MPASWGDVAWLDDPISAFAAATANVSMGGFLLTNVGAPVSGGDAANKTYVDAAVAGIGSIKEPVRLATAAAPAAYTRAANVITFDAVGSQSVDGSATALNDRILLKDGAAGADNGIYYVSTKGTGGVAEVWTRATDADTDADVKAGMSCWVNEGTANGDTRYTLTTNNPITLNTTALTFAKTGATTAVQAGSGIIENGNAFDVNVDNSTIEISADALRIKDLGVTTAKINDLAVTTAKIAASNVTVPKLSLAANPGLENDGGDALRVKVTTGITRGASGIGADFATSGAGKVVEANHAALTDTRVPSSAQAGTAWSFANNEITGLRPKGYATGARPVLTVEYATLIYNSTTNRLQAWRA